jgi:hypothetical protein
MSKKNKIILSADTELRDNVLWEQFERLWTKVETLNERTKRQTLDIRELRKQIKDGKIKKT